MRRSLLGTVALMAISVAGMAGGEQVRYFDVPRGAGPHDVAPAPDGTVWYTAQRQGALGRLDPKTRQVEQNRALNRRSPAQ